MKKTILFWLFISLCFFDNLHAQNCTGGRYHTPIFPVVDSFTNIQYGSALAQDDTTIVNLKMNIYYPANDTDTKRPIIILAHGGSFIFGDKSEMTPYCEYFASLGYVTASINYRLLNLSQVNQANLSNPDSLKVIFGKAVVRAVWDMKAAVRFFRKSVTSTGNPYGIDTNRVIVGGASAGGITADLTTYAGTAVDFPADVVNYINDNGGLEGTSGNSGYGSIPQLCISMCGAVNDTNIIQSGAQPYVGIHNLGDPVIPNISGYPNIGISVPITLYGDSSIYKRTLDVGVPSAYLGVSGNGHCDFSVQEAEDFIANFLFNQICGGSLSIIKPSAQSEISVYPNPSTSFFNIVIPGNAESWNISMINLFGQTVCKRTLKTGNSKAFIPVANFEKGVYLIRFVGEKGETILKKVVVR